MLTTTLAEIRSHGPCDKGFAKIRDHFGVSAAEAKTHSKPFPIALLILTNGITDTLWVAAHVAPNTITRFVIRRLDDGEHSALKTLRRLDGEFTQQIEAVETIVSLLRRKLAGEDVREELRAAAQNAYYVGGKVICDYAKTYGTGIGADKITYDATYATYNAAHAAHAVEADDANTRAAEASYLVCSVRQAADAVARDDIFLRATN